MTNIQAGIMPNVRFGQLLSSGSEERAQVAKRVEDAFKTAVQDKDKIYRSADRDQLTLDIMDYLHNFIETWKSSLQPTTEQAYFLAKGFEVKDSADYKTTSKEETLTMVFNLAKVDGDASIISMSSTLAD